jgi:hypothetical protein
MFLALPIIATILLFIALVDFLANWGMKLLAAFTEAALQVLEAAIKIIILVLAYLLLALDLLIQILFSLVLLATLAILSLIMGFTFEWQLFYTKINLSSERYIETTFEVYFKYYPVIDLELPVQKNTFISNINNLILSFETSLLEPIIFNFDHSDRKLNSINTKIDSNTNINKGSETKGDSLSFSTDELGDIIVVANMLFDINFEFTDSDKPPAQDDDNWEEYAHEFRYRIKRTDPDGSETYIIGKSGDWYDVCEDGKFVWEKCPKWGPNTEYPPNIYSAHVANEIRVPEYGIYTLTCEIKDNENDTASADRKIRAYPKFMQLALGSIVGSVTSLIPWLVWAYLTSVNDYLKTMGSVLLPIATLSISIGAAAALYYNFGNIHDFWGYILGFGWAITTLGFLMAGIALASTSLEFFIVPIISLFASAIFSEILLDPYNNYPWVLLGCEVLIQVFGGIMMYLDKWAMKGFDESIDKLPYKKSGSIIGLVHIGIGFLLVFIAQDMIRIDLDIV